MNKIKAWSYSAYGLWKQCPLKYKYQKFDKLPQKESIHLKKGIEWHEKAEFYLKGKLKKMPKELEKMKDDFKHIMSDYENHPEEQWAFTEDLEPCSWFDKNCWLRIKIDNYFTEGDAALLIDFKTGKMRDGYEEQLGLYAFAAFIKFPEINRIITELWYLDHGAIVGGKFNPNAVFLRDKDFERLKASWLAKIKPMFAEKKFLPKTSYLCNWCDYQNNPCTAKYKG